MPPGIGGYDVGALRATPPAILGILEITRDTLREAVREGTCASETTAASLLIAGRVRRIESIVRET